MNTINNQKILAGFIGEILGAEKQIKYNAQYMDHKARVERDEINFMNVITHPTIRIVLRTNEFAVTRAVHPNPRFARASNVILMRGTQYGLIAMFGKEAEYKQKADKTVTGPLPGLHTTRAFLMAASRFFKRRGIEFHLQTSELQLLNWIFSDSFTADLEEQAREDVKAGIALGDGLPPKPPYKRPANKVATAGSAPSNDAKFERREKPNKVVNGDRRKSNAAPAKAA